MGTRASSVSSVAFVDLTQQYATIRDEVRSRLDELLQGGQFILGSSVAEFEERYASYCNARYAIGVDNGTNALALALEALNIGQGDEVITAANTFVATAEAISHAGAKPVLADIRANTYTIDVKDIEARITGRTKALIPVHLYGEVSDMRGILEIARRYGLFVLEDAAQAHGAIYDGQRTGSMGDAGCFSFYPAKNLGAYGDGGAIVCNDRALETRIRKLRDHGAIGKYEHEVVGYNSRLDALQAAVLLVKLKYLDEWNRRRRELARLYNTLLSDVPGIVTPSIDDCGKHVFHLYVIRVMERRDALQAHLEAKGIATGIHYPQPIHLTRAFSFLGYGSGEFPLAEAYARQILSLPMYPELTRDQVEYVVGEIVKFMGKA